MALTGNRNAARECYPHWTRARVGNWICAKRCRNSAEAKFTLCWLTSPIEGVTRLPPRTADRGMRAGVGGRVDAIRSTEVAIITSGRLTEPIVGVTRLPPITVFRDIRAG